MKWLCGRRSCAVLSVVRDARGSQLQELAPLIVSREAGKAFLGYLQAQRPFGQRRATRYSRQLSGSEKNLTASSKRLGFQGVEIMQTGALAFPMREPERTWLFGVRQGEASMNECLTRAGELEREIKDLLDSGPIRATPDREAVEHWMVSMYFENWKARALRYSVV